MKKNQNSKSKIVAIIQARIVSTRLPGKVLLDVEGKPMLWHVIERLRRARQLDEIILAIPDTKENDVLEEFAKENNLKYFRGPEEDVLSRYYLAAKSFGADTIVRITSDCPLVAPEVVDRVVRECLKSGADYTSNILKRTYPKGLDVEVFTFEALEKSFQEAKAGAEKEHVTLYIREHPEKFRRTNVENDRDLSRFRWTVDEKEDLEFVQEVYKKLFQEGKIFSMKEIIDLLRKEPKLVEINKNIKRKPPQ